MNLRQDVYLSIILVFLSVPIIAMGDVKYVDLNATGANDGSSWGNAYTDLTNAIAKTSSGTDLWVAKGTYYPSPTDRDASFTMGSGVNLYGGFAGTESAVGQRVIASNPTYLNGEIQQDGNNANNTHHIVRETYGNILDGFIICNGYADDYGAGFLLGAGDFGGIYNCVFSNNYSVSGGAAISAWGCNLGTVSNCQFIGNTGSGGGTLYGLIGVSIVDCIFSNNAAGGGAGILDPGGNPGPAFSLTSSRFVNNTGTVAGVVSVYAYETVFMRDCQFIGNTGTDGSGGGVQRVGNTVATGCLFSNNVNSAGGGGVFWLRWRGTSAFTNCVFVGNTGSAGGVFQFSLWGESIVGVVRAVNCVFRNNSSAGAGGVAYSFGASGDWGPTYCDFSNCTFHTNSAASSGSVIANPGSNTLQNCIVWGNPGSPFSGGTTVINYSDVQGGYAGTGNLNTDPLFVDAVNGDLHEKSVSGHWTSTGWVGDALNSPCIDAGDPAAEYSTEPSPNGNRINMGAYGNTSQASKSIPPGGTVFSFH